MKQKEKGVVWFLQRKRQGAEVDATISKQDLGTTALVNRMPLWSPHGKGLFLPFFFFLWETAWLQSNSSKIFGTIRSRTLWTGTQNIAYWVASGVPGAAPAERDLPQAASNPGLCGLEDQSVNVRTCFHAHICEFPGDFWNNGGGVSYGEEWAGLLYQLRVGEDRKKPSVFGFLIWPILNHKQMS